MTSVAYVYAIVNRVNGKRYIGSTIQRPDRRYHLHTSRLRARAHHSYKLQSAWDAFGPEAFCLQTLLVCSPTQRLEYEERCMALASYNIVMTPTAVGTPRRWIGHVKKVRPPHCASTARKQEWADPEVRRRRVEGLKRALASPEVKARQSAASTGRRISKEAVARSARAKWRPLYCQELQVCFLSQAHAAAHFGVVRSAVTNAVKQGCKIQRAYTLQRL